MKEEMISIIIPIYNVEKYLKKCIESVISQTYTNLEVILVDDESPDNCGDICEEYALKDKRIRVFHKKNGGLSDARNYGINKAKGKFIGFVDGDDFVMDDMYETLYNNIINYNADISICGFYKKRENEVIGCLKDIKSKVKILRKDEAIKGLLKDQEITNHAWNKLYRKELFDTIKYPKGKVMEDLATTYLLFEKCNKIVFQDIPKYIYIQRDGSILKRKNEKFLNDLEEIFNERYQYLVDNEPQLEKYIMAEKASYIKFFFNIIYSNKLEKKYNTQKYENYYKTYINIYKEYKKEIIEIQHSINAKIECEIFYLSKTLYKIYVRLKNIIK